MVKLGDAPQQLLRYHLAKGTTSAMEVVMDYEVAANDKSMKMPTLVLETETTILDVQLDGTASTRTKVVNAAIRAREGAALPGLFGDKAQRLVGVTFAGTVSAGGRILSSQVVGADKVAADLADWVQSIDKSLRAIAMPLPDVPVGVGAQWKHRATVNQQGIHGSTVTSVELVSIDKDKVTYTTTTEASGADQHVTEQGQTTDVKHVGGHGSGRGTVDLAKLAMTGELSMSLSAEMTTNEQTAKVKATTTAQITAK